MVKIYEAKHHVPIAGKMKAPGDCFAAELSKESEAWLLGTGAIKIVGEQDMNASIDDELVENPEESDTPVTDTTADEAEVDEAGEAPEIDPTEGIIGNESKTAAKKRGGKKQ